MTKPLSRVEFDKLLLAILPDLESYSIGLMRDRQAAEELRSVTIYKMLKSWEQFDGRMFKAWAFTIMRNARISDLRHPRARKTDAIEDMGYYEFTEKMFEAAPQDSHMAATAILETIDGMPSHHRQMLIDLCVLGETYQDIADRQGVSIDTVKSRVWRARDGLKKRLGLGDAVL